MPRYNNDGRTAKFLYNNNRDRGGGGGRGGGGRHQQSSDQVPRVSFRDIDLDRHVKFAQVNRSSKAIQRKRGPGFYHQKVDEAGDVVMDGFGGPSGRGGRGRGRGRGRGGRGRGDYHHGGRRGEGHVFGHGWHKIIVFNGAAHPKEFILNALVNASRKPFIPFTYVTSEANSIFYIEGRDAAESIAECSGRITSPDSQKINLRVSSTGTPLAANLDDKECEAKIRIVLEKRYDPLQFSLSLENFYKSPEFTLDHYLPLMRPSVCDKVFSILEVVLPTLVALDLSNNKLTCLDNFALLKDKSPNMKILVLTGNKIQDIFQIDKIQGLGIEQLMLDKNPLCDKYSDQEKYIRDVRKRLPKVMKLDGFDIGHVAPQISFDLAVPSRAPSVKSSFFANEEAKQIVGVFLEQYIKIYDSDDRKPLAAAYHDNATMSMAVAYSQSSYSSMDVRTRLTHYLADSRNLLRNNDKIKRYKLLHSGRGDIIQFLDKLTKTTHDTNSFVVDMPIALPGFVIFHVTGVFKERPSEYKRSFHRTFSLVPMSEGRVCICNEMLLITNPTTEQTKESFKPPAAPTPSPSPIPYVQQTPAVPGPSSAITLTDPEMKSRMISQFSAQSGMNADFSQKCLEQNGWDFEKSGQVFLTLQTEGKIPPEAFVK